MAKIPWKITREMFLESAEVSRLLSSLDSHLAEATLPHLVLSRRVDRFLIHALLFSGLRNSEFCRLTLGDTCIGTSQPVFLVRGTPREDRAVYIPQALNLHVEEYVRELRPRLVRRNSQPTLDAPLLLNERGGPYERTALYRRVVRILTTAGFAERASVQLLRHTYGYLAYLRTGGNLLFVQKQLGHAHPMVTAVYSEFVTLDPTKLANSIGE